MNYNNAIKSMSVLELSNNSLLKTFINTASSTFDSDMEISIWTSNPDILFSDMRNVDKLVLSVATDETVDNDYLSRKINIFKEVLSIDFNTDFRITTTPLKIPMVELWSTTKLKDVWVDLTKFNVSAEDIGKTIYVPYDYYLFDNPIIFVDKSVEFNKAINNTIKVSNINSISRVLPYLEFKL